VFDKYLDRYILEMIERRQKVVRVLSNDVISIDLEWPLAPQYILFCKSYVAAPIFETNEAIDLKFGTSSLSWQILAGKWQTTQRGLAWSGHTSFYFNKQVVIVNLETPQRRKIIMFC